MKQKSSDQLLESLSALVDGEASELEFRRLLKTLDDNENVSQSWERYHLIGDIMRKEIPQPQTAAQMASTMDLSASISKALADDDSFCGLNGPASSADVTHSEAQERSGSAWKAWLGKSSVAASVAAAFVFGFGQLGGGLADVDGSSSISVANVSAANTSAEAVDSLATLNTVAAPLGFELPAVGGRTVSTANPSAFSARQSALSASTLTGGAMSPTSVSREPLMSDVTLSAEAQELLNQLHLHHAQRASLNGALGVLPFARISSLDAEVGEQ